MCGIAGVVLPGRIPALELIERMAGTLEHRGPDDCGYHVGPDIGLGFRRLSIVDLETGNQPAVNSTATVRVVFNGEIYNFRQLRARLEERGHVFRTRGDAEILPHLYEEYGADMVHELRGMFAFALWDEDRRQLLLARDRAGEKPLYYTDALPGGGFGFASEIKALLAADVSREPDRRAILQYLYHLYVPAPHCAFARIFKLSPGHLLWRREGRTTVTRYWRPRFSVEARSEADCIDGLRRRIHDAVTSRLVSDVPVGAFLSGGIDSSSVVASMCAARQGPVHTFTIAFEGFEHYDESAEARVAADFFGTEHHELRARLDGPAMLPGIVDSFDEPFGNATAALVSSLAEVTREHVKVVLTGDGADELFFGYPRYRGLALAQRYRQLSPAAVRRLLAAMSILIPEGTTGNHTARRAREFLSTGAMSAGDAYAAWIGYFTPAMLNELLNPELAAEAAYARAFLDGLLDGKANPDLNDISQLELQSFLPYNVLEYADKMSMAHGLELRAPFVDHHLVEYVGTLPAEMKLRGGTTKWALRQALGPELPPQVLRRVKRGLNPPLGAWLSAGAKPLIDELLSPDAVRRRGLFRPDAVMRLLDEQRRGRRDRSLHIWALLVLELWFRRRVDLPWSEQAGSVSH